MTIFLPNGLKNGPDICKLMNGNSLMHVKKQLGASKRLIQYKSIFL